MTTKSNTSREATSSQAITKFELGKTYVAHLVVFASHKLELTVISRTAKTIKAITTASNDSTEVKTLRISVCDGVECVIRDYPGFCAVFTADRFRAEVTTQGEITESDVNFTDGEWDITPTPDGSNSGNTPSGHNTLKSAVASHFNADKATKSFQACYLAFYRKLTKANTITLDMCGEMVTITRLANGTFEVISEMPAPAITPVKKLSINRTPALKTLAQNTTHGWNAHSLTDDDLAKALMYNRAAQTLAYAAGNDAFRAKIPKNKLYILHQAASKDLEIYILREYNKRGLGDKYAFDVTVLPKTNCAEQEKETLPDWHTIIDDIAISDFNLTDSSEWADLISESEIAFDAELETEHAAMQCDNYDAEQAIERKNLPPVPSFELLATKAPAKAKRAGRAKFVQMTGMLFDLPKVSATDLIARRAAQPKALGDRLPPAPLFRGI